MYHSHLSSIMKMVAPEVTGLFQALLRNSLVNLDNKPLYILPPFTSLGTWKRIGILSTVNSIIKTTITSEHDLIKTCNVTPEIHHGDHRVTLLVKLNIYIFLSNGYAVNGTTPSKLIAIFKCYDQYLELQLIN